jgi:ATP-dependent Clp protease protease subunit
MDTLMRDSKGVNQISIDAAITEKRMIFLSGEINEKAAEAMVKQLMFFSMSNTEMPVKLFITTDGGEINSGMVIYDAIQSSPVPVEVYCVGKAYSMGAVLLACGKKGKRYLLPHSRVMIHEPLIPYGVGGKTSSIQTISESLLKAKRSMEEILAKHTGKTADEIAEATKTDHYFSAEEAIEFGLADGIMGLDEMMKGCM